jgi:hypothetical protein
MLTNEPTVNQPGMVVHTYHPSIKEAEAEDLKFEVSLGYIVRPYLKKDKKKREKWNPNLTVVFTGGK